MKNYLFSGIIAIAAIIPAQSQHTDLVKLPKYQTPVPIPHHRIWYITQNLGPTGARGWVLGSARHTLDSKEILIKSVEPGSPAAGILRPYDLIVGARFHEKSPAYSWKGVPKLKRFEVDARMSLARAITWAESKEGKGKLQLLIARDTKISDVIINIPILGNYANAHPLDCPKSQAIAKGAADLLARTMPADGYRIGIGRPKAPLHMLGMGEAKYLDHVRRSAMRVSLNHEIKKSGKDSWRWGNTAIFLCEYYLATGDERVLPDLKKYIKRIANAQYSPGSWGHTTVQDFVPPGYGAVNSTGVTCFLALVLGEQIGLEEELLNAYNQSNTVDNGIRFFGSFAGLGSPGYGDHGSNSDPTGTGKNGPLAVAFRLLGSERIAQWYGQLCAGVNMRKFEAGHSGNYFTQVWTPLGVSLTGRDNYRDFWQRFQSYRDLARRHDGSFMTQPQPHGREGDLGSINYVPRGPHWTTGGYALSYIAGNEQLAVLGRKDSVFAANPPAELLPALAAYKLKDYKKAANLTKPFLAATDARLQGMAKQLIKISKLNFQSVLLTLEDMKQTLSDKDLFKLKYQYQAILSVLDENDSRLDQFENALSDRKLNEILEKGSEFHNAISTFTFAGEKGFRHISYPGQSHNNATINGTDNILKSPSHPYHKLAEKVLADRPAKLPQPSLDLVKANQWKSFLVEDQVPRGWFDPRFGDSRWDKVKIPVNSLKKVHLFRTTFDVKDPSEIDHLALEQVAGGNMTVYLNGTLILDLQPRDGRGKSRRVIPLTPSTVELLERGKNTIAVHIDNRNAKDEKFDFGLKAALKK